MLEIEEEEDERKPLKTRRHEECASSAGLQRGSHFLKNFTRTSNQWHHHRGGLVTAAAPQQNCRWTGTELPSTPEEHGRQTLHICYRLAGKQEAVEEHCENNGEMLFWRLERTRLGLTSPPVWSSAKPCRFSFKRCKWISKQSLKAWRHTVHTAESHSQTNCSSITWLSGFS